MAISDPTGELTYKDRDIAGLINKASSSIKDIVGTVKLSGSNKDFAGMDIEHISTFETAIDKYRSNAQDIVNGFNIEGETTSALKGDVATAVYEYLNAMKILINRYIAIIDVEKKEIQDVKDRLLAGSQKVSSDIKNDSDSIRSTANNIVLD